MSNPFFKTFWPHESSKLGRRRRRRKKKVVLFLILFTANNCEFVVYSIKAFFSFEKVSKIGEQDSLKYWRRNFFHFVFFTLWRKKFFIFITCWEREREKILILVVLNLPRILKVWTVGSAPSCHFLVVVVCCYYRVTSRNIINCFFPQK